MFPDPSASPRPDSTAMPSHQESLGDAAPRDTPPGDTAPQDTAPQGTWPRDTWPQDAAPGGVPAWVAPNPGAPPVTAPPITAPPMTAPPRPSPFAGLGRVGKTILIRIGVAAVVLAALVGFAVVRGAVRSTGTQVFPSAVPSSQPTSTVSSHPGTPFDGTPAAGYPEGAAGLAMPRATAITGFSQHQVATALAQVHDALVAGRLDSTMVVDRDPAPFLALVSAGERDDLRHDFDSDRFSTYATQVAPGHRLSAVDPRVKGRTTFRASTNDNGVHEIKITTNYVWVYAFDEPESEPGDNLVIIHDEVTWNVPNSNEVSESDRGLWMDSAQSYGSNVDCTEFGKGLIAPGIPQADWNGGGATDDPDSMFDPDHGLDISTTC